MLFAFPVMIRPRVSGIFPSSLPPVSLCSEAEARVGKFNETQTKEAEGDSWSLSLTPTEEAEPGEQWLQTNEALQLNAVDRMYPSSRAWNAKAGPGA